MVQHTAYSVWTLSTLRSLSSTFANLLWSALGACSSLSVSLCLSLSIGRTIFLTESLTRGANEGSSVFVDMAQVNKAYVLSRSTHTHTNTHHPPCFPSPYPLSACFCCPGSVCHREHELFSLGRGDSMIGASRWSRGDKRRALALSLRRYQTCPPYLLCYSRCLCLSLAMSVPGMRWLTQAAALGILGQLIILPPGDTAPGKLGHQVMQAC